MSDKATDKRPGFFMIENSVIDNLDLKPHTGWLYCVIVRHVNQKTNMAFPGIKTLAKKAGMTRQSVMTHLEKLEEVGLIEVKRTVKPDGSKGVNHYYLMPIKQGGVVNEVDQGSQSNRLGVVNEVDHNKTKGNKTKEKEKDSPQAVSGSNEEDTDNIPLMDCPTCKYSLALDELADGYHCGRCNTWYGRDEKPRTPPPANDCPLPELCERAGTKLCVPGECVVPLPLPEWWTDIHSGIMADVFVDGEVIPDKKNPVGYARFMQIVKHGYLTEDGRLTDRGRALNGRDYYIPAIRNAILAHPRNAATTTVEEEKPNPVIQWDNRGECVVPEPPKKPPSPHSLMFGAIQKALAWVVLQESHQKQIGKAARQLLSFKDTNGNDAPVSPAQVPAFFHWSKSQWWGPCTEPHKIPTYWPQFVAEMIGKYGYVPELNEKGEVTNAPKVISAVDEAMKKHQEARGDVDRTVRPTTPPPTPKPETTPEPIMSHEEMKTALEKLIDDTANELSGGKL